MHLCYIQIINICKLVTGNTDLFHYGNGITENNKRRTENNPIADINNDIRNQNGVIYGTECQFVCYSH